MLKQVNPTEIEKKWATSPRWQGVTRTYTAKDVLRLRGTIHIEHSLARLGAERLWQLLQEDEFVSGLGALTGNQATRSITPKARTASIGLRRSSPTPKPALADRLMLSS